MYNLQSPKVLSVFASLPDLVSGVLRIVKTDPPISAMVKLNGKGQVVESKNNIETSVSSLMKVEDVVFVAR